MPSDTLLVALAVLLIVAGGVCSAWQNKKDLEHWDVSDDQM